MHRLLSYKTLAMFSVLVSGIRVAKQIYICRNNLERVDGLQQHSMIGTESHRARRDEIFYPAL